MRAEFFKSSNWSEALVTRLAFLLNVKGKKVKKWLWDEKKRDAARIRRINLEVIISS